MFFRNSTICHLVHPLVTVLDDSIGCALWFASRGHGVLYPSMQPYQSTARVRMHVRTMFYDIAVEVQGEYITRACSYGIPNIYESRYVRYNCQSCCYDSVFWLGLEQMSN